VQSAIFNQVIVLTFCCLVAVQGAVQNSPRLITRSGEELLKDRTEWQEPEYPPIARMSGAGGPIVVEVEIDEQGNVVTARVVSGHPLLQAATLKAIRAWKFKPVEVNYKPVRVTGRITYTFPGTERVFKEKTTAELERQVQDNLDSFEARYELGTAYLGLTRYGDAVLQFSAAIRIKPHNAEAYLKLGHAYSHLRAHEKALRAFTEAARLDPKSSEAFHSIGLANIHLGKCEAALEPLKHSLQLEGPITTSHFLLGKCLLLLSRPDEAVIPYKNGLAKYADSDMGHYGLGEVYLELEQYSDAITEFKEALRLSDGQGKAHSHYHLGLAYLRSGNRKAALKEYELLKKINSELANQLLQEIRKPTTRGVGE
jgi:TonB family protein